jgi:NAD(P)-dependent dehydrogenase (short-subunit alcohol dehydrogenase family)
LKRGIERYFDLEGKVIVLTGSAGILGTQYANILSEAGADMILIDTEKGKNENLGKKIKEKFHTNPSVFSVDITNKIKIKQMIKQILKDYGRIDVLINNAVFHPNLKGGITLHDFKSYSQELWNKSISVDLTGVFFMCQAVGAIMEKQKKGNIVNISSIYGVNGADQRIYGKSKINSPPSYAATKGAIVNLTKYLAANWHNQNIRVNTLSLGGVRIDSYMDKKFIKNYSKKTMLGRMAKEEEYSGAMLFLASEASSYMTGSNMIIDGGWTAW